MPRLHKRTSPPLPLPVAPEPETTLCAPVEEVPIERKRDLCTKCRQMDAWRNGLCYDHYKESEGFVYDAEQNRYVLQVAKKKGRVET